jgi:phosphate-selective porin OprO and OprP
VNIDLPGSDSDFTSYHVGATYTLTGESRAKAYRIDAGEFKRLRAEPGGVRPLELAARYASIDLNSGSIQGGEEDVVSLGLNWYYSGNLRLMWNWSRIVDTSGGSQTTADADGLDIFTFRAQLNF